MILYKLRGERITERGANQKNLFSKNFMHLSDYGEVIDFACSAYCKWCSAAGGELVPPFDAIFKGSDFRCKKVCDSLTNNNWKQLANIIMLTYNTDYKILGTILRGG